ncbi:hypothetical protein AAC387_Pa01g1988 [Persea americana]
MAGLQHSTPGDTPLEVNVKLSQDTSDLLPDAMLYRRLVGSLVYLTITQLDISYAINLVSQFTTRRLHLHLAAIQRIVPYILGTLACGLFFTVGNSMSLIAYSDAD